MNDLKELITPDTKLLVINFPHNPTGAKISEQELREVLELAAQNNTLVFSDEMYWRLEHDPADQIPSASDLYDNAISLFGMSKSFALAGLRLGWLATKNADLLRKFAHFKDYTTICSSAPSEILAIMALRAKEKIFQRNLDLIKGNLMTLDHFFAKHEAFFDWHSPNAGPIGFPKLKTKTDITDFCLDLIEKKGLMLLPASVYDYNSNHFRVGFARKNMPLALEKLEEYIEEH